MKWLQLLFIFSVILLAVVQGSYIDISHEVVIPISTTDGQISIDIYWVSGQNMFQDIVLTEYLGRGFTWPYGAIPFDLSMRSGSNGDLICFNTYSPEDGFGNETRLDMTWPQGRFTVTIEVNSYTSEFLVSVWGNEPKPQRFSFPITMPLSLASGITIHPYYGYNDASLKIHRFGFVGPAINFTKEVVIPMDPFTFGSTTEIYANWVSGHNMQQDLIWTQLLNNSTTEYGDIVFYASLRSGTNDDILVFNTYSTTSGWGQEIVNKLPIQKGPFSISVTARDSFLVYVAQRNVYRTYRFPIRIPIGNANGLTIVPAPAPWNDAVLLINDIFVN